MIPTIETDRLILRAPKEGDLPALATFMQSPRSHFIGGPKTRHECWRIMCGAIGHWHFRGFGMWNMEHKESGRLCGACGFLNHDGWPEPELGWNLHDDFEGKGLALEAALAARAYGAKHFGLDGVISLIVPENTRSIALAERLGATYECDVDTPFGPAGAYRHPKEILH